MRPSISLRRSVRPSVRPSPFFSNSLISDLYDGYKNCMKSTHSIHRQISFPWALVSERASERKKWAPRSARVKRAAPCGASQWVSSASEITDGANGPVLYASISYHLNPLCNRAIKSLTKWIPCLLFAPEEARKKNEKARYRKIRVEGHQRIKANWCSLRKSVRTFRSFHVFERDLPGGLFEHRSETQKILPNANAPNLSIDPFSVTTWICICNTAILLVGEILALFANGLWLFWQNCRYDDDALGC